MTVSVTTSYTRATGNGVTTVFNFAFKIFAATDLAVRDILDSTGVPTTKVLTTDYSVVLSATGEGGTVTMVTATATAHTLDIRSLIPLTQSEDIRNQGRFLPEIHEGVFDKLERQNQDTRRIVSGAIAAPDYETPIDMSLPNVVSRASQFLAFDATGKPVPASGTGADTALRTDLANTSTAGKGNELISYRRTAGEIAATVTPVNFFYQPGIVDRYAINTTPGTTNMTTAILNAIASMPAAGGSVTFLPGQIYAVDSSVSNGLNFSGRTNFKVYGNGATIKVLSGQSVVGGFGMVYFTNSQDGYIENLVTDANRAGRVPNGSGAFNYVIQNSCARLHFKNCRALNAVEDGWTLTTSVPGTLSTYPTDITIEDCSADNSYRCGMSIIGSLRCKVQGGSYINTNGASPQLGIDVEPDVGFIFGNTDLEIIDVLVYGNTKGGITVTGPNASPNTRITIAGNRLANNGDTAIQIAQCGGVVLRDNEIGNHVGSASLGVVHVGDASGNVSDVTILNTKFRSLTSAGAANAGLRVSSTVTGPVVIDGLNYNVIACPAMQLDVVSVLLNVQLTNCTSTSQAIKIPAARAVLRNIHVDTTTGSAMVVTGSDLDLDGFTIIDFGASASAGIQFEAGATGSVVRNGSFMQRTSIPAGTFAIRYNGVVPRLLRNVVAKSAGTDFTAATIFSFVSGTTGSYISDNQPDPFRLASTFNFPSIANGSVGTNNFTVTGAALGDLAFASTDVDLVGLTISAYVKSANTVTVAIANNTGGAVDLANANFFVWVEKR